MNTHIDPQTAAETARALPTLTVGGLTLWGVPLNDVVLVLTFVYTAFLILDKLPTVIRRLRQFWNYLKGSHDRTS